MEVLILILVIYGLAQVAARKAKLQQSKTSGAAKPQAAAHTKQHAPKQPHQPQRQTAAPTPRGEPVVAQPRQYQTLQPRVTDTERITDYGGSLGVVSAEGTGSGEGEDFCDPALEHGRDAALYGDPGTDRTDIEALPEEWNADTLVRAVIMNEILSRPRQRRRA